MACRQRPAPGLALLAVLLLVALVGVAMLMTAQTWQAQAQRAREAELLAIGTEMRAAIAAYMRNTPNGPPQLPGSLDDLLLDRRYPMPVRYLRRIYDDPFTGRPDWQLIRGGAGLIGLHSRADVQPYKQQGFPSWALGFDGARRVADWQFVVVLPESGVAAAATAPAKRP